MEKFVSIYMKRLFSLFLVFLCGSAIAGQWQPLCIEGSSCKFPYKVALGGGVNGVGYRAFDRYAAGPLVTNEGILLHHNPFGSPLFDDHYRPIRHVFQLSDLGLDDFGDGFDYVSDVNAIQSETGRTFSFQLHEARAWFIPDLEVTAINWSGRDPFGLNLSQFTGPPVIVDNVMYAGIQGASGVEYIYRSTDDGDTWAANVSWTSLGSGRFNLLENPEKNALWAIRSDHIGYPKYSKGLFESNDHGDNWWRVDDGSFPHSTVRVVHDPENPLVSYALTNHGLFVSVNGGISWQATSMAEPIHGMVFVERNLGLSRALIVGTDTGVWVSVDEAVSWISMGNDLPEIPHTVTYGHGQLIATSDAGYFTCNAIDCAGLATPVEIGVTEIEATYDYYRDSVKASWKPVDYATVYRVFRCLDDNVKSCGPPIGFRPERFGFLPETLQRTYFYDNKGIPGVIYHYRVRACIKNRCGDFSAAGTGFRQPSTPTDIEASDGTFDDHVRVSWVPVDGADVFRVFRCPDTDISSCGLPISYSRETSFNDTRVVSGTIYHFRVRACTKDICSEFSEANTGFIN